MRWPRRHIPLTTYQAGLLQSQAYRALCNHLTATLKVYDLSLAGWAALGTVHDAGQLRLTALADSLGVKPPVATTTVRELERLELVERTPDPRDQRAAIVRPTVAGREIVKTIERQLRQDLRSYLRDIPLAELIIYLRVLQKLAAKL